MSTPITNSRWTSILQSSVLVSQSIYSPFMYHLLSAVMPNIKAHLTVTSQSRNIEFKAPSCLLFKCLSRNADRPQERWTHLLLRGSAQLPRPSQLKLASLWLASGTSLRLAFYALPSALASLAIANKHFIPEKFLNWNSCMLKFVVMFLVQKL